MREFKFRIWDKKYKQWAVDFGYFKGAIEGWHSLHITSKELEGSIRWWKKNVEIMQFTGLHDKNGIEIFEGDIVEIQHPCWTAKCRTDFFDGAFFFVELNNPVSNSQVRADKFLKEQWDIVVLGNIYEHPELLKTP